MSTSYFPPPPPEEEYTAPSHAELLRRVQHSASLLTVASASAPPPPQPQPRSQSRSSSVSPSRGPSSQPPLTSQSSQMRPPSHHPSPLPTIPETPSRAASGSGYYESSVIEFPSPPRHNSTSRPLTNAHTDTSSTYAPTVRGSNPVAIPIPPPQPRSLSPVQPPQAHQHQPTRNHPVPPTMAPFHYPSSRSPLGLSQAHNAPPMPTAGFMQPRSGSAMDHTTVDGLGHRPSDSEGSGSTAFDADSPTDGESRHRFTLGDTYEYNRAQKEGFQEAPSSGWEQEDGQTKTVRKPWFILLVVLLLVGAGVGLGIGIPKVLHEGSTPVQDSKSSSSSSSNSGITFASPSSSSSSASSSSSSTPSIISASLSTSLPSVLQLSTTSASPTTTVPAATKTSSKTTATTPVATVAASSLNFAYYKDGFTTSVDLTYTIPSSGVETRANGQLQFTEKVTLANPNPKSKGQSFTTDLRFRVATPTSATSTRERTRREIKGREKRWGKLREHGMR